MVLWIDLGVIMSVVNDVLTDLHKRRSQQIYQDCLPFISEQDSPVSSYLSRYILGAILFCTAGYAAYFYFYNVFPKNDQIAVYDFAYQASDATDHAVIFSTPIQVRDDYEPTPVLPSKVMPAEIVNTQKQGDFNFIPSERVKIQDAIIEDTKQAPATKSVGVTSYETERQPVSFIPLDKTTENVNHSVPEHNSKVRATESTKIAESVNTQASKSNETRIANRTKDEDMLKQLMVNQPEKVWPYIQKILPQSSNKVGLMALGAQGEQRSRQYGTALELYLTLSQVEPRESKWRVGAAISYDALGDKQQALFSYQQSLQLSPLPPALFSFVTQRIAILNGASDE